MWDARSAYCDTFHSCTRFICYCVSSALAYTSAGPLSLKQNCVFTFVTTSGHTDSHTAHSTHIGSGAGYSPCTLRRTAEEASLSASGSDRKRRDDRVIHYLLILSGAMASSAQKIEAMSNVCDGLRGDARGRLR